MRYFLRWIVTFGFYFSIDDSGRKYGRYCSGRYPIGMYCLYYSSSDISLVANGYRVEMVITYPLDSRIGYFPY